ncbi:MAG TPA: hydroxyacid dehydrogenase [Porphyromonadaceae bacterium]|jgi:D-3-phosphoglycerate dehydrogenase|nr:hydroxyacid dehydrogenase [Porphyromonadaceae bacterium]HBX20693.1 hydroxyacid dehydrogenase [Porphyromonadaceae bacterium]HCM20742.1 hydroxyacid dehydrogenase [Porphyromonadaceae bacterium]
MKIIVLEPLAVTAAEFAVAVEPLKAAGHKVVSYDTRSDDIEELQKRAHDADVLVIANMPLRREIITSCSRLKMLSVAFTGVDHVDIAACRERGIAVSNCAGYSTQAVAELVIGLMIGVMRNMVPLDNDVRRGGTKGDFSQREVSGKTLGIVGTGAIGQRVAAIAAALGCRLLAYNRTEKEEVKKVGASYVDLDTLLSESDIVSLHLPLNEATHGLISRDKLALMKRSSILINTSRGGLVDNQALADTLASGGIAGAGIDVFDMEPPIPSGYALLHAPNTVLTPHIGFASQEAMRIRAKLVFENIIRWMEGKPQNVIVP